MSLTRVDHLLPATHNARLSLGAGSYLELPAPDPPALVLVWLRVMYDFQDQRFFFVADEEMRDATREWASWVIPLLVVELWLSWLP